MYHRVRRKMRLVVCAILILVSFSQAAIIADRTATEKTPSPEPVEDNYENNVIDFDDEYSVKFNQRYGAIPWHSTSDKSSKESHRYTIVKDELNSKTEDDENKTETSPAVSSAILHESTTEIDFSVIPLELISTTENYLLSIIESTTEEDLSVIPLYTTVRDLPNIQINETATLPTSTQESDTTTDGTSDIETTTEFNKNVTKIKVQTTTVPSNNMTFIAISNYRSEDIQFESTEYTNENKSKEITRNEEKTSEKYKTRKEINTEEADKLSKIHTMQNVTTNNNLTETTTVKTNSVNVSGDHEIETITIKTHIALDRSFSANNTEALKTNSSKQIENVTLVDVDTSSIEVDEKDVPVFTELDAEEEEVPEDYYDGKDVVPTTAPKTNALSVLVGLAGSVVESVVESVAERVVPKGIYDLFKRMQKQSEALEGERLRSREENGGLGQFGRGILKSISSGLSKPLSQLMAGAKDIGSLDTDRGFVSSVASGVSSVASVANSLGDAFKDRVQAIYPGTVWCGDGHSPTARSGELGLFFFTDTCCRQHDACKIYIKSGDTKYGLTNTGLFTRSHCSCDAKFRDCLRRTNSLVSAQIGLTYFNVLGPQCFRRAHPIVKCLKRTRITGQKCEEYEFDYTKPKMWQWFDNETF